MSSTISVADSNAALAAGALGAFTPVAGSFAVVSISSQAAAGITITPAVTAGSFAIEGSEDGGLHYTPLLSKSPGGGAAAVTTVGGTFLRVNATGVDLIRVRAISGTVFGNGAVTVTVSASDGGQDADAASGGGGGPATLASGAVASGAFSAGSIAVGAAVDGSDLTQGAIGDTAWSGSGNSTVVAALKAIYGKVAGSLGFSVNSGTTDATTLRVITASDGPLNTNLGLTTDAGVTSDVNGTVSAKLRGLVILAAARWPVLGQGLKAASVPVTLASDQGALAVSGTVSTNPPADTLSTGTISAADVLVGGAGAALTAGVLAGQAPTANSSVVATVTSIGVCFVQVTPAVSAGSLVFEGSIDGTNYFAISGITPGAASAPISSVTTATIVRVNAAALAKVRIRAVAGSAFGSGNIAVSVNASIRESLVGVTSLPALTAGSAVIGHAIIDSGSTTAVSGTVAVTESGTWNVGVNDGTTTASNIAGDSGQNSQVVSGARKEVSYTTTTAQAVGSTDCSNYRYVSVHSVTQGGSSTVTFQGSNDNTNWTSVALLISSATASNPPSTSATTANVIYHGPVACRYFRLNVTGIVSGTTAGVIEFFATPPPVVALGAYATLNAANSGGYSFNHISTAATTVVKSGAGTLHTLSINIKGVGGIATVYDNTAGSGTVIAVIDDTLSQDSLIFDLAFATGLTVVTTDGGVTHADLTVTYK